MASLSKTISKMKKIFLTATLFLSLTGAAIAAPVQDGGKEVRSECSEIVEIYSESILPEESASIVSEALPDGIQESAVAKKMTQAEKAHNAEVNDSWGGAITIIAMSIVVSALVILSLLFLGFGKISEAIMNRRKKETRAASNRQQAHNDDHEVDSGEAIAAIAMALSEHFGEGHDIEDTILTIRRMKRAYSPWNSKIYNLRTISEPTRNTPQRSAF